MTFTWTAMIGLLFSYTPAQAAASSAERGYPLKPIRFVIGPSPDLLARIVGQKLTESWGQQVIVDARPGAKRCRLRLSIFSETRCSSCS
jgi:tripartite-type tricarboxylate transporter receptor subunit TctC